MTYLLVRHKVKNYAAWKVVFDEDAAARKAAGEKSSRVLHVAGDPNEIVVLCEWDSVARARQFMQPTRSDMAAILERAGVLGQPEVLLLENY
jgi:hypothetical protein